MDPQTIHMVDVPAKQIPTFRYHIAKMAGVKQIMLTTWGGLGDQVCGEPAARYAFELFPKHEISLITTFPELFSHLPFKKIYSKAEMASLSEDEWLVLHTNPSHENMARDFLLHHYTQCVDFSTLCAFQRQIPIASRQIVLPTCEIDHSLHGAIVIHPGRHWQSKTFPSAWWSEVIKCVSQNSENVVVVGKDVDSETGTVDVTIPGNVTDLRNKLSLLELSSVLQSAKVVITNDSAPLHIASAGDAMILYVATCKADEYLTHWRKGQFGFKMKNLGLTKPWEFQHSTPIRETPLAIDQIPEGILLDCLPEPSDMAREALAFA